MEELQIQITKEIYDKAIEANSGGCIVAEAIKAKYPRLRSVKVDVATVQYTDMEKGERCVHLTPAPVAETVLYFDQGWKEENLPKTLRIKNLVRVRPIARSIGSVSYDEARRAQRLAELESKEKSEVELTPHERGALKRMRKPRKPVTRPTSYGKTEVEGEAPNVVIRGGREIVADWERNPNLLGGRNRHFGGKKLEPSVAVKRVVDQEVQAAVLAERAKQAHE